jgi:hypothetical protein
LLSAADRSFVALMWPLRLRLSAAHGSPSVGLRWLGRPIAPRESLDPETNRGSTPHERNGCLAGQRSDQEHRRLLEPIGGQPFLDRGLGLTSQLGVPDPGGRRNEVRHAMSMTAASRGVEDAAQVAGILLPAGTQPRLPQGGGTSSPHRSPSRTGPWISGLSASPFGTPMRGPMLRKRLVDHE